MPSLLSNWRKKAQLPQQQLEDSYADEAAVPLCSDFLGQAMLNDLPEGACLSGCGVVCKQEHLSPATRQAFHLSASPTGEQPCRVGSHMAKRKLCNVLEGGVEPPSTVDATDAAEAADAAPEDGSVGEFADAEYGQSPASAVPRASEGASTLGESGGAQRAAAAPAPQTESSNNTTMIIVVCSLVGLLLLILGAALWVRHHRKKRRRNSGSDEERAPLASNQSNQSVSDSEESY